MLERRPRSTGPALYETCPVARNQVEVGVRNGSEEQRFARFRFRDLDFVSIVVDLDDVADRALWGAIGPMLIARNTSMQFR